jgi:hypothetical protein
MEAPEPTETPSQMESSPIPGEVKSAIINNDLLNIPVADENVALNLMVSFLNVAQKRGVFSFDESAKIWECIQRFIPKGEGNQASPLTPPSE